MEHGRRRGILALYIRIPQVHPAVMFHPGPSVLKLLDLLQEPRSVERSIARFLGYRQF